MFHVYWPTSLIICVHSQTNNGMRTAQCSLLPGHTPSFRGSLGVSIEWQRTYILNSSGREGESPIVLQRTKREVTQFKIHTTCELWSWRSNNQLEELHVHELLSIVHVYT